MRLLPKLRSRWERALLFIETLSNNYGIDYRAPFDARNSGLESGSIDCITSTKVLSHIPEHDLGLIIGECNRLLRADGLAAFVIDYRDQYSYSDRTIGPYNFLQFGDVAMGLFQSVSFAITRIGCGTRIMLGFSNRLALNLWSKLVPLLMVGQARFSIESRWLSVCLVLRPVGSQTGPRANLC